MTTDTGMVELCAEAIAKSDGYVGLMAVPRETRVLFLRRARAVLECLRTPTPEMVGYGEALSDMVLPDAFLNTKEERRKEVAGIFTAMIDRALSPSKGEGE